MGGCWVSVGVVVWAVVRVALVVVSMINIRMVMIFFVIMRFLPCLVLVKLFNFYYLNICRFI